MLPVIIGSLLGASLGYGAALLGDKSKAANFIGVGALVGLIIGLVISVLNEWEGDALRDLQNDAAMHRDSAMEANERAREAAEEAERAKEALEEARAAAERAEEAREEAEQLEEEEEARQREQEALATLREAEERAERAREQAEIERQRAEELQRAAEVEEEENAHNTHVAVLLTASSGLLADENNCGIDEYGHIRLTNCTRTVMTWTMPEKGLINKIDMRYSASESTERDEKDSIEVFVNSAKEIAVFNDTGSLIDDPDNSGKKKYEDVKAGYVWSASGSGRVTPPQTWISVVLSSSNPNTLLHPFIESIQVDYSTYRPPGD